MALKVGQKRVGDAREYLNKFANGKAMPALALKDNKTNVWEPVMMVDTYLYYVIKMGLLRPLSKDYQTRKKSI